MVMGFICRLLRKEETRTGCWVDGRKGLLVLNFSVCCLKVRMCENRCRRERRGGFPMDTVLREGRQAIGTRVRKEDTLCRRLVQSHCLMLAS